MHHIASDGWSMAILIREFVAAVRRAAREGGPDPLPPLAIQYADYAALAAQLAARRGARASSSATGSGNWPGCRRCTACRSTVRGRPCRASRARGHAVPATEPTRRRWRRWRRRSGRPCSWRCSRRWRLAGAPWQQRRRRDRHAGRQPPAARDSRSLIGFFVNTLVLRTDCGGNPRFTDYLQRSRRSTSDAQPTRTCRSSSWSRR